jgi:hypothetical protein
MYKLALDRSIQAMDGQGALEIVDELAKRFKTDHISMKAEALDNLSKKMRVPSQQHWLAEQTNILLDDASEAEMFALAVDLAKKSLTCASASHDAELIQQAKNRIQEANINLALFSEYQSALDALVKSPDDPSAHLASGVYDCYVLGDWKTGLRHFLQCGDAELQSLATRELQTPTQQAVACMALADAWWDAAQSAESTKRIVMLRRAGFWYKRLQKEPLAELDNAKIAKRLESLSGEDRKSSSAASATRFIRIFGRPFSLMNEKGELVGWNTNRCHFNYVKGAIDLRSGDLDCPIIVKNATIFASVKCRSDDFVRLTLRNCDQGRYYAEVHNNLVTIVKQNRRTAKADQMPDGPEEILGSAPLPKTKTRADLQFIFAFQVKNNDLIASINKIAIVQTRDKTPLTDGSVGISTTNSNTLFMGNITLEIPNAASLVEDRRKLAQ